jgi:CDP-glucose 4,6-dehydratase
LCGYLVLGGKMIENGPRLSGAWNFGASSTEITTVREVVEKVIRLWGKGALSASSSGGAYTSISYREARCLRLDCTKAYSTLNWRPHYNLDRALRETIEWYRLYYDGADKKELYAKANKQIGGYMQELSAESNT